MANSAYAPMVATTPAVLLLSLARSPPRPLLLFAPKAAASAMGQNALSQPHKNATPAKQTTTTVAAFKATAKKQAMSSIVKIPTGGALRRSARACPRSHVRISHVPQ